MTQPSRPTSAAVKGMVSCDRGAEPETEFRRTGGLLKGHCTLPDHEDRTPSFYCYPDGQGFYSSWRCTGDSPRATPASSGK
jgi:hypothetical protein